MALKNYIVLLQLKLFPINLVSKVEKFVKFQSGYPQKAIHVILKSKAIILG